MASLDLPKLRPLPRQLHVQDGESFVAFTDSSGAAADPILIPVAWYEGVVRHFDGGTSLDEIQSRVLRETGQWISSGRIRGLVEELDRALILDGPTFASFRAGYRDQRTRPAAHSGRSYAGNARALRTQMGQFFDDARGSGPPRPGRDGQSARLRGIVSPHIDFQRGGPTYTWAYQALAERSDADTFVILGVAHQFCRNRFALTRKDFETPLGLVPTDRGYVDRLVALAGDHLLDDELAHRTEHSVEFQAVFLQYLLGGRRDFAIVPILVGSFHDLMEDGIDPIDDQEVRRFVHALREAEEASGKKVAYIGGIDLGHVGPEFGDPEPVDDATLDQLRRFDGAMLDRAGAADPAGWFARAAEVENRWRVCGLAATYTFLHAIGPARGQVLRYDQAVNDERTCCVSFASLAFEAHDATHSLSRHC